jgi:hypothetical protein
MRLLKVDSSVAAKLSKKISVSKIVNASEVTAKTTLAETKFLELIVCNDSRVKYIEELHKWNADLQISPILQVINKDNELNYTELEQSLKDSSIKLLREALVKSDETYDLYKDTLEEELKSCINAIARLSLETQLEEISNKIKTEADEPTLFKLLDEELTVINKLNQAIIGG